MLQRVRLPHLNSCDSATYDPRAKYQDLLNVLLATLGHFQLIHLLAALENPNTPRGLLALASPCGEYTISPCCGRSDILWRLGTGDEDEVQASAQVVGLQAAADGGGDLEGGLSERNRGKWYISRGDESNSLERSTFVQGSLWSVEHTLYGAKSLDLRLRASPSEGARLAFSLWRLITGPSATWVAAVVADMAKVAALV